MPLDVREEVHDGVRRVSVAVPQLDSNVVNEAAAGTESERQLGFWKSLKLYRKACLWSIFFSTCIIMEGFDLVLVNSLYGYPVFLKHFGYQLSDGTYALTAAWQSGLSNGSYVGQLAGLCASGIFADRFGYRKTLIGALAAGCGFIFIIFFAETLQVLLVGEIFFGLCLGAFQALTNTYASEVCPVHLRAYLTTYVNLCWVIGQFLASGVLKGMLNIETKWAYKIPFALQWIWPIPLIIGIYLAPESPWWLVRKNRLEEAKRSLERLTTRNSEIEFKPDETISMMIHTNELEKEMTAGTTYFDLFKGTNLRRTEIVSIVWLVQAYCGSSFMGYSTQFYQRAGLDVSNSFSMSLGQYALGAVGTIFSWFLMIWFGRRFLYLWGSIIMFCLLLIIGFVALAGTHNTAAQWVIGSMLLIFTFVYDSTVGPVCYSLVAELSSTRLRTKSVVMARSVYNIGSIISNIITPRMLAQDAWNWGAKSGFFFAGTTFLCIVWIFFRLPEPKGRTYGELDVLFEQGIPARQFAKAIVEAPTVDVNQSYNEKGGSDDHVERVDTKSANN